MRPTDYLGSAPFRIAAGYAALFALSVALLFAALYWQATREMTQQLRAGIEQDARPLLDAWREGRIVRLVQAVAERAESAASARDTEAFYLLRDARGRVVAGNVERAEPFEGWREVRLVRKQGPRSFEAVTVLAFGVELGGAFLLVGRNAYRIAQTQQILLGAAGWAIGLTVLLALIGGIAMSRASMRRLEAINRTAREVMEGDLSLRVPVAGSRDELDRLSLNINLMLDRIHELMDGLRQVSGDIAHDLRTPLGRLQQRLETARRREDDVEGLRAALDDAIAETQRLIDTFNALLRIAQIEAGARRAQFADVDLTQLVQTVHEAYESVAEDRRQTLAATVAPGIAIRGDRHLLTQLCANLVENAIRHAPEGTPITLGLAREDGAVALAVADRGPGIPEAERDRVFRRFYRLEQSRTTPGSGLGLSLVKAVADLHSATIRLVDNGPGLRVVVRFPVAS